MKQSATVGVGTVPTPVCSDVRLDGSEGRSGRGPVGRRLGSNGFTMVELLVAIVIAGILVGAAMPSFLGLIQGSRLNAATRQVVSEIRAVQSLAVTRSGVFGFHWGGDPGPPAAGRLNSEYRIERDPTEACGWPAPTDTMATNANVITEWRDLSVEYPGITITAVQDNGANTIGGPMFSAEGESVNTCGAVSFPLTITIGDGSGATRIIQVRSAGSARIQ